MSNKELQILRKSEVCKKTGFANSTLYKHIADGMFPKPVPIGPRSVGWLSSEVDEYIRKRIALRDTRATT